jgi:hypothetical protein
MRRLNPFRSTRVSGGRLAHERKWPWLNLRHFSILRASRRTNKRGKEARYDSKAARLVLWGATRESHTSLIDDKPSRPRSCIRPLKRCHNTDAEWLSQHPSHSVSTGLSQLSI